MMTVPCLDTALLATQHWAEEKRSASATLASPIQITVPRLIMGSLHPFLHLRQHPILRTFLALVLSITRTHVATDHHKVSTMERKRSVMDTHHVRATLSQIEEQATMTALA